MVTDLQVADNVKLKVLKAPNFTIFWKQKFEMREMILRLNPSHQTFSPSPYFSFKQNSDIDPELMKQLPSQRPYIAFATVTELYRLLNDEIKKNKNDKPTAFNYSTSRKMTVTFKVYDLEMKKLVWSGDVNKSKRVKATIRNVTVPLPIPRKM